MIKTQNTAAFIEANVQSAFILRNLHDGLLPETFYRNVSDFMHGSTLEIKTIGSVTLQEVSEDTAIIYSPIETGKITMTITEEEGDAYYITDNMREDGHQVEALLAARAVEGTRSAQESFETKFLIAAAAPYVAATTGLPINGFAHFIVSGETNDVVAISHLVQMKLAFDKANVPSAGRVFICDPVVEATLNGLVNISTDVTPWAAAILEGGLSNGTEFFGRWMGWTLLSSNRLPIDASATDGSQTIINARMNLFMNILDDQTKPIMGAWRRMPKVEGERDMDNARDKFVMRQRYGFGVQRLDTMGCLATHATNIA